MKLLLAGLLLTSHLRAAESVRPIAEIRAELKAVPGLGPYVQKKVLAYVAHGGALAPGSAAARFALARKNSDDAIALGVAAYHAGGWIPEEAREEAGRVLEEERPWLSRARENVHREIFYGKAGQHVVAVARLEARRLVGQALAFWQAGREAPEEMIVQSPRGRPAGPAVPVDLKTAQDLADAVVTLAWSYQGPMGVRVRRASVELRAQLEESRAVSRGDGQARAGGLAAKTRELLRLLGEALENGRLSLDGHSLNHLRQEVRELLKRLGDPPGARQDPSPATREEAWNLRETAREAVQFVLSDGESAAAHHYHLQESVAELDGLVEGPFDPKLHETLYAKTSFVVQSYIDTVSGDFALPAEFRDALIERARLLQRKLDRQR